MLSVLGRGGGGVVAPGARLAGFLSAGEDPDLKQFFFFTFGCTPEKFSHPSGGKKHLQNVSRLDRKSVV